MIDKVLDTINSNNMFEKGDKVIIGVSGGPDSMCLLDILYKVKGKLCIKIAVAHVNHCLRGKEADEDEKFVQDFCAKLNIEFYSKRVDVNKLSKDEDISCEMAGREARYSFFKILMKKIGANKIALAHNANDRAETILMRIMRGTGIEGLTGIRPVRDNIFVRPLINIYRSEIENYCSENNIIPRIDKTNLQNIYSRNKIRLDMIPYIQKNFNSNILTALNRMADTVNTDNEFIQSISNQKYKKYCKEDKENLIISKEAFMEHDAVITRIIRMALCELTGSIYNFEKVHIYDIMNIQKSGTGKSLKLPFCVKAYNVYGDIYLKKESDIVKNNENNQYILDINKTNIIDSMKLKIDFNIIDSKYPIDFKADILTKYFNYDKIKGDISIRYRKAGDTFIPFGMKGKKKLKDLFIDLKVPREKRNKIPLISFGDDIAWIVGYRVSNKYIVEKNTKNILQVKIEREE